MEYVSRQAAIIAAARDAYRQSAMLPQAPAGQNTAGGPAAGGTGTAAATPAAPGASTPIPLTSPAGQAALSETGAHQAVLAASSLARELVMTLDGLVARGEAHVTINSWLPVSLCVATATMTSLHGVKTAMSSRSRRLAAELAPHTTQQQRQQAQRQTSEGRALPEPHPAHAAELPALAAAASTNAALLRVAAEDGAATAAGPPVSAGVAAAAGDSDEMRLPLRPLPLGEPPLSSRLRPFHALLLLDDAAAVLETLPVGVTEGMRVLVGAASPLRSLQQLQLATGIDELHLLRVAEHLVVWGRATPIPVITRTARFVTSVGAVSLAGPAVRAALHQAGPWGLGASMELGVPVPASGPPSARLAGAGAQGAAGASTGAPGAAGLGDRGSKGGAAGSGASRPATGDVMVSIPGIAEGSSLALAFEQAFVAPHGVPPLAQVLQVLSKPRSLEQVVLLLQPRARPAVMDVLVWLLRRGLLDRVRQALLLLPSADIAPALCQRLADQDAAHRVGVAMPAQAVWEAARAEAAAAVAARRDTGPDTPALPTADSLLDAATSAAALLLALAADVAPLEPLRTIIGPQDGQHKSDLWRRRHRVLAAFVQIAPFCDGQYDVAELLWRTSLAPGDVSLVCEMLPDLVIQLDS